MTVEEQIRELLIRARDHDQMAEACRRKVARLVRDEMRISSIEGHTCRIVPPVGGGLWERGDDGEGGDDS